MPSKLAAAIKQSKPFSSLEEEVALTLFKLVNDLGYDLQELLKTAELSAAQYNILRILRGAGPDGLACNGIGERLLVKSPDMTRLLDRLEQQTLIRRERSSEDRRIVYSYITKKGLEALDALDEPIAALHKEQFGQLSKKKLEQLLSLLEEVNSKKQ
jgi:DNA-binding MarR family transcriptional regulator